MWMITPPITQMQGKRRMAAFPVVMRLWFPYCKGQPRYSESRYMGAITVPLPLETDKPSSTILDRTKHITTGPNLNAPLHEMPSCSSTKPSLWTYRTTPCPSPARTYVGHASPMSKPLPSERRQIYPTLGATCHEKKRGQNPTSPVQNALHINEQPRLDSDESSRQGIHCQETTLNTFYNASPISTTPT